MYSGSYQLFENTGLCTKLITNGAAHSICGETRKHVKLAWYGTEVFSIDSVLPQLKKEVQNWILESKPESMKIFLTFMHFPL